RKDCLPFAIAAETQAGNRVARKPAFLDQPSADGAQHAQCLACGTCSTEAAMMGSVAMVRLDFVAQSAGGGDVEIAQWQLADARGEMVLDDSHLASACTRRLVGVGLGGKVGGQGVGPGPCVTLCATLANRIIPGVGLRQFLACFEAGFVNGENPRVSHFHAPFSAGGDVADEISCGERPARLLRLRLAAWPAAQKEAR